MVGFAVLSVAFVQRLGGHVRMELILTSLRGRWLWFAETLGGLLAMFIVGILIPSSYSHFQRAFEYGDSTMDIELVTWPAKLVVPLSVVDLIWTINHSNSGLHAHAISAQFSTYCGPCDSISRRQSAI